MVTLFVSDASDLATAKAQSQFLHLGKFLKEFFFFLMDFDCVWVMIWFLGFVGIKVL